MLIVFDTKAIIVETKSGNLSSPSKRGGIKRLQRDLKKLIEDAYHQGKLAKEYITSSETAVFSTEKGDPVAELKYDPLNITILLANVTLEPLLSLAIDLHDLEKLGLFKNKEYTWSVNLRELDILTRHIPSASVFIHYLEQRAAMQSVGVFSATDELSLLGWYLDMGNFYVPTDDDGKQYDMVSVDGWTETFDDYYLRGKEPPWIQLKPEIIDIVKFAENRETFRHTNFISTLLDFPRHNQEDIVKYVNEFLSATRIDKRPHDFSVVSGITGTGLTIMIQPTEIGLVDRLIAFCELKKYQTKARKWIGIAYALTVPKPHILECVYLDYEWETDDELQAIVERLFFKEQ